MNLPAAVLQMMLDKGLTLADVVEIAQVWEAGCAQPMPELSKGALRTRKWREKKEAERHQQRHGDVTVTRHGDGHGDVTPSCARVRDNLPKLVTTGDIGGGVGGTRERAADDWPKGKARDHAAQLVAAVASPRLDPAKSPGLVTTMGRLEAWRRDGASWEHDVVPVVTALCAKQRSPVSTWKFFDQAIARSIADNRAALEIPEAGAVRATGPPGRSFSDQIAAEHAEARRRVLES